jgi:hypothetical protein
MDQLRIRPDLMEITRNAFIDESGGILLSKYESLNDSLFIFERYTAYAEDMLERMTNPFLGDLAARTGLDPVRKLCFNDRIFGTMCLANDQGIEVPNLTKGAFAGLKHLLKTPDKIDCRRNSGLSWKNLMPIQHRNSLSGYGRAKQSLILTNMQRRYFKLVWFD